MRRLMFGVLAFPAQKVIEPFAGGGFALMQVLNPTVDCTGCNTSQAVEADDRVHTAASKAFSGFMGVLKINNRRNFNSFAHNSLTRRRTTYIPKTTTPTRQAGIRWS